MNTSVTLAPAAACLAAFLFLACQPCGPVGVVAELQVSGAQDGVALSWRAHPEAERYRLQRRLAGVGAFADLTETVTLAYLDSSALPATFYEYRLLAQDSRACIVASAQPVSAARAAAVDFEPLTCNGLERRWLQESLQLRDVRWSPADAYLSGEFSSGFLRFLDAKNGQELFDFFAGQTQPFLAWSPDEQWAAFGGFDQVRLLAAASGVSGETIGGDFDFVQAAAWNQAQSLLAIAGGRRLFLRDLAKAAIVASRDFGDADIVALAWDWSSDRLAIAGDDGVIAVWTTPDLLEIDRLATFLGDVTRLDWQPDGALIVGFGGGVTRIYAEGLILAKEFVNGSPNYDGRLLADINAGWLRIFDARVAAAPTLCTADVSAIAPPHRLSWAAMTQQIAVVGGGVGVWQIRVDD